MARGRRIMGEAQRVSAPDRAGFWRTIRERVSLPGVEAWSTSTRTVFLNGLFLLTVIVVLPVFVSQFRREEVVIEPIAVPEALAAQGMTPEVAANRVWDGIQDVVERARTDKQALAAIPDARRVEFSFPDSGFSIESLVYHVRKLFNAYETRIAGEFTCADAACGREGVRLRLRVIRNDVEIIEMPPLGGSEERRYFADAASNVLGILDPFVALAATADEQPKLATTLARRLIRSHHKDAKWAHNLVGLIRINEGDFSSAKSEFEAALALDPAFRPSLANLGQARLRSGELDAAAEAFGRALAIDGSYVPALDGMADLALQRGDRPGAIAYLERAAEADPANPLFFAKAGRIELGAGRKVEGVAYLKRALDLDPGSPLAFATLAAMHLGEGDMVAAEKVYRDAADYAPDDAEAQASAGRMAAILKDWDGALRRFGQAARLAPLDPKHRIDVAKCLQALGRHEEALAELDEAAKIDANNAEVFLARADSLRDTGRKSEAVAAYKQFLALDKTGSVMRPVAERFITLLSESSS